MSRKIKMFEDGQYCVLRDAQELVRFIGNLNGDYSCNLGVIEDSFGSIRIVRLSDIRFISVEEAIEFDQATYEILSDYGMDE